MQHIIRRIDSLSSSTFRGLKWFLSALSGLTALSTVMVLETT